MFLPLNFRLHSCIFNFQELSLSLVFSLLLLKELLVFSWIQNLISLKSLTSVLKFIFFLVLALPWFPWVHFSFLFFLLLFKNICIFSVSFHFVILLKRLVTLDCLLILKNRSLKPSRSCVCILQPTGFIIEWPTGDPATFLGYSQPEVSVELFLGPFPVQGYGGCGERAPGWQLFQNQVAEGGRGLQRSIGDVPLTPQFEHGAAPSPLYCTPLPAFPYILPGWGEGPQQTCSSYRLKLPPCLQLHSSHCLPLLTRSARVARSVALCVDRPSLQWELSFWFLSSANSSICFLSSRHLLTSVACWCHLSCSLCPGLFICSLFLWSPFSKVWEGAEPAVVSRKPLQTFLRGRVLVLALLETPGPRATSLLVTKVNFI